MSAVVISGDTSGSVTLQAPATAGSTTLTLPAVSGTVLQSGTTVTEAQGGTGTTTGYYGFKNRIINGAMVINQRGYNGTPVADTYTLDRWQARLSAASKYSVAQSSTAPTGFVTSMVITSSSAYTLGVGDYFAMQQPIEGYNTADLGWGTANAQTITVSFWVRSSLTGTFGGALQNDGGTYCYPFSYTISSANTFEQKSITITGPTSGTWATTTGSSINLFFALGVGSTYSGTAGSWVATNRISATGATSVVGTSGATFYVTGVQLEKGSTATSFDYRPYGTELILCQRYYQLVYPTAGNATTSTIADMIVSCFTPMRANATLNQTGVLTVYDDQVGPFTQSSSSIVNLGNPNNVVNTIRLGNFSGLTTNRFLIGSPANPSNYVSLSAEL